MNTIKFLNSNQINAATFAADMAKIRGNLFKAGICWTDDVQGQFEVGKPFRVVLYARKTNVDYKNPIAKECNGLVVEYDNDWNLLAQPRYGFCKSKISMKKLNDLFVGNNYDVFEVLDATILTLYFWKRQWRVSSTKGYDIGDTEMFSNMTFMNAIEDLMAKKYRSFRFEDLNPELSYTIALRHSQYHIFDETKHFANRTRNVPRAGVDMNSYIMVMGISDIKTGKFVEKHVPGLPQQSPIGMKSNNVYTLVNYARSAYAKYAKAYRLQNFKYKPLYGYILRAKNRNVPTEYSTIYIESELFKVIKLGLYKENQALRELDHDQLVIRMAMNHERLDQFNIMFQQFEGKFQKLEESIDLIATEATRRIISDDAEDEFQDEPLELPERFSEFVSRLVDQFQHEHDISSGIIKDAMYGKIYHDLLLKLLQ